MYNKNQEDDAMSEDDFEEILDESKFFDHTSYIVEKISKDDNALSQKLLAIWQYFLDDVKTVETSDFINFEKMGIGLEKITFRVDDKETRKCKK